MLALFLLLQFSGWCVSVRKPNLSETSGIAQLQAPPRPLILIHGFLGSKLRDRETHQVAWGKMANILTGRVNDGLALPLGSDDPISPGDILEPFQIYDGLWGVEYYSNILRILHEAGGYQVGDLENPKPGDNAFVFVYDWRRDIVESAGKLAETIDQLKSELGNPDLTFDLLTHSQGGLLARYYILYGGEDVLGDENLPVPSLSGAANVEKVIMLGTPNRGCLEALKILHLGVKKVFRPMPPHVVFSMPALYQMLPPRDSVFFSTLAGDPVDLDLYDPETWVQEELSVFSPESQTTLRKRLGIPRNEPERMKPHNRRMQDFLAAALQRAQRFRQALDAPVDQDLGVSYHAVGSDCLATLKSAVVLQQGDRRSILFDNEQIRHERVGEEVARILYGPGDGTVLMRSLLDIPDTPRKGSVQSSVLSFDSAFFVCESHGLLPNDPFFQNNLFYLLLWDGKPSRRHPPSLPALLPSAASPRVVSREE
jgi:pimeloyl-ACP methyl ester carboxylesterase